MLTDKEKTDIKRYLKSANNSIAEGYGYAQIFSPKEMKQVTFKLLELNDELEELICIHNPEVDIMLATALQLIEDKGMLSEYLKLRKNK